MRPSSIVNFERLALLAVALGALVIWLSWDTVVESARAQVRGTGIEPALAILSVIYVGLLVLLIFLTSRRGSAVARWLFVLITVATLLLTLPKLPGMVQAGTTGWIEILQLVFQVIAVALLFTAASRAWFREWRIPGGRPVV
jgi:cell division protein FtsW (lipid II flippase)